jgi:hypothetical protein
MKIVKLNRRWKQYKEHHHTVAFRFDGWSKTAKRIEDKLRQLTNTGGWTESAEWYSYFGKAPDTYRPRPYYITMRDESLMSAILLSVDAIDVK